MSERRATRSGNVSPLVAMAATALLVGACVSREGLSSHGQMVGVESVAAKKSLSNTGGKYASTWPSVNWWHALGDPQLDALIDEALKDNPDLGIAKARTRQADSMTLNAVAKRSPTLTGQAAVLNIRIPGSASFSSPPKDETFKSRVLGLNGSYTLDLWGGQRAGWEAALGRQRAAEVDAQAARLKVSVDVALAYIQLDYVFHIQMRAQRDVDRSQKYLDLTSQRVAAGIESIAKQREAESFAAAARRRLAQMSNEVAAQQIVLAILIGKGPDRANDITQPTKFTPLALSLPENLPAELLGRRPDIVAARWRVEAAQRDIDVSKAGFYPSFNLNASIGLTSFRDDDLLSLRSRYYSLAPAISLPIFDGGRLRADLASRNAAYDIAVAQYNKNLVAALNDVATQIQVSQSLIAQETEQQQSAKAAKEAWKFAVQRYERGIGSYIDALIAEQALIDAQAELNVIRSQQMSSAVRLVYALGGGFSTENPNNSAPVTTKANKASS